MLSSEVALLVADVYEAAGALRRAGETIAAAEGQTQARWQLLSVLSQQALTVPQAARRLGVSRQAVQRVADALIGDGLVEAQANPDHRTSPLLSLSPSGRRTLERITARAQTSNDALGAGLPPAEIALVRQALRHVIAAARPPACLEPAPRQDQSASTGRRDATV